MKLNLQTIFDAYFCHSHKKRCCDRIVLTLITREEK
jgi:hypothetical protein